MSGARPIPDSYWVVPNLFLAGAFPGSLDDTRAEARIARFLDAGIRTFVDLTEDSEPLVPYAAIVGLLAAERGVECRYVRHAIRDHDVPTRVRMREILDEIRIEIAAGRPVYVHCWGGVGRTGTVVGCWLIEEGGLESDEAIMRIADLRRGTPGESTESPEMEAQRWFVCDWGAERRKKR